MHTAARCPVPTRFLEAMCTVIAVVSGIAALCTCATMATVRRHRGGGWSSVRVVSYGISTLGTAALSAATALLGADVKGGLADAGAAWRSLLYANLILYYGTGGAMLVWDVMLAPAVQFVGSLDARRRQALTLAGKGGMVGYLASIWGFAAPGLAMGLFGASGTVQDIGAALEACGYVMAATSFGAAALLMAHQLKGLARELGPATSSGQQVANLRRTLLIFGVMCAAFLAPCYTMVIAVPALRNVSGTIATLVKMTVPMTLGPLWHKFERTRLVPSHAVLQRRLSVTLAQTKVHPLSPALAAEQRFGRRTIAALAAHAHRELAQDVARRELLLAQEQQSSGVPLNGVSLQLLRDFASEFGVDDLTTAGEVCARYVKPTTAGTRCALVTVLQAGRDGAGALWCDKPTHFISYAWTYPFRLLLDILECFEEEQPPPAGTNYHYFLDQFSLNQHTFVTEDANQAEMQARVVAALEGQMIKAGHVLMCLHPWDRPVPLSRAWCLFELYVALESKCKLSMCFGRKDTAALFTAAKEDGFTAGDAVGEIDAIHADATEAADKQLIIGLIESTMGIERFNATMQAALLQSFKATVAGVVARAYSTPSRTTCSLQPPQDGAVIDEANRARRHLLAQIRHDVAVGARVDALAERVDVRMGAMEEKMGAQARMMEQITRQTIVASSCEKEKEGRSSAPSIVES